MLPDDAAELTKSYFDVESRRDVEAVLLHYAPDATFVHPGGTLVGREQIRSYYEESAAEFPGLTVTLGAVFSEGQVSAVEWSASLTDPTGGVRRLEGVNVAQAHGGQFSHVRTYFDPAQLVHGHQNHKSD